MIYSVNPSFSHFFWGGGKRDFQCSWAFLNPLIHFHFLNSLLIHSWQFCWRPFWDSEKKWPEIKGESRPPTIADKTVTAWITWLVVVVVVVAAAAAVVVVVVVGMLVTTPEVYPPGKLTSPRFPSALLSRWFSLSVPFGGISRSFPGGYSVFHFFGWSCHGKSLRIWPWWKLPKDWHMNSRHSAKANFKLCWSFFEAF